MTKTFTITGSLRTGNGTDSVELAVVQGGDMDTLHAAAVTLFGGAYTGISITSDGDRPCFIFAPLELDAEETDNLFDEAHYSWEFYDDEGDPYAGTYSEM